ncbi:unnamed protein product [Arabidopsis lyrata]|nr:unnamed protein product [Arabidopsis lyrata]
MYHYLDYDPIHGDYKVLCMTKGMNIGWRRGLAEDLRVLTLGNGSSWRMIEDFPPHAPESLDLCIDGVLYYEAYLDTYPAFLDEDKAVMSFDVRSEKFHLIKTPETALFTKLTRYEGKLAIMGSESTGLSTCRIDMWVLVDAAKHEWSNKVFVVPCWNTESCIFSSLLSHGCR